MSVTRRDFLRGATVLAGAAALGPVAGRAGRAFGVASVDPSTAGRRRLVVIELCGGNDGFNTVVPADEPVAGTRRYIYDKARTRVRIERGDLLSVGNDGYGELGLHPSLRTVHRLYGEQRVAIVQGVGYDPANFSHFVSGDIWQAGTPGSTPQSGWLGRHLDRTGIADGELRALAIGSGLPLALTGAAEHGAQLQTLPPSFPDGRGASAGAIHAAYAGYDSHPSSHPLRHRYGQVCGDAHDLVTSTSGLSVPTGSFGPLVNGMLAAREVLGANLGVELVSLKLGGFDTHADQLAAQGRLLRQLDLALEAFFYGTYDSTPLVKGTTGIGPLPVADRTLVLVWSEFGRRIGDNGTGTDHGAAEPLLLVGPPPTTAANGVPRLVPGFHGRHPDVGTVTPAVNLASTTDMRQVYRPILGTWLNQPVDDVRDTGDPLYDAITPVGLFA